MPITTLPALSRTATTFKADVDNFFGTQLPALSTEINALEANVNAKEASAVSAAGTASTKAGEAATSASNALASKNAAGVSASAALDSQNSAGISAGTATTQAGTATTKAAEAAASAASVVRDGSGGVAGLTGFAVNIWNAAKTSKSLLSFAGSANRAHVLPDKSGTVAMMSDFAAPGPIGSTTPSSVSATTLSATGVVSSAAHLSAQGLSTLAAGKQVRFGFDTSINNRGLVQAYDQASSTFQKLHFEGSSFEFSSDGATNSMTLDASGNFLVGVASGANHTISKNVAIGSKVLDVANIGVSYGTSFYSGDAYGANAALAVMKIGYCATGGRSITAGGSIIGSGADYAEYERNNGLTINKGDLVGFKVDGTLTNVFADAIRFAVKTTNPSFVGGDSWGSEDQVGKRPEEPQFTPAQYAGSQAPTEPAEPTPLADDATQEQIDTHAAAVTAYDAAKVVYDAALYTYTMDMAQHAACVEVSKSLFDTATYPEYLRAKAAFEAVLEAARVLVDRIAYSGKVPCNVMGATPGGYIIASPAADGSIAGIFVADPDFTQYKKAVGRVNKVIDEAHAQHLAKQINVTDWQQFVGRCEVAVIIH